MDVLPKVLIVDDDPVVCKILCSALADTYEVRTESSGEAGLEAAHQWHPNMILLDVEMPGRNGYEVCDQLKHDDNTSDIPVVFLSSRSSLRERLLGFEVGAEDYLVKPCSKEILHAKLDRLHNHVQERRALKHRSESAEMTVLEAMTTSSDLGRAIRFVEQTYLLASFDDVARCLLDVLSYMGLSCCALFVTREGPRYYSSTSTEVGPLEQQILVKLHDHQRIHDFGCRTQINYSKVALLIKNMPLDDRSRYGRIKDTVPFMLGATDAKIRILDAEQALVHQSQNLTRSVEAVQQTLIELAESLQRNQESVGEVMRSLTRELDERLPQMGLDDDQEAYLIGRIDQAALAAIDLVDKSYITKNSLGGVVRLLQHLVSQQNRIIEESFHAETSTETPEGDDVELF